MAPARITQEAILADVRRLAAAHPRLTWTIIRTEGRYATQTYAVRGAHTLTELLRLAGVPPRAPAAHQAPLPAALTALGSLTEEQVVAIWRQVRWPDAVRCPRCGDAASVSTIPTQRLGRTGDVAVYACADCAYHFSDVADTVFHGLMMPLRRAALVLAAARLGVPRTRLAAFGLSPNGGGKIASRAADSRLAQTFIDRLLAEQRSGVTREALAVKEATP